MASEIRVKNRPTKKGIHFVSIKLNVSVPKDKVNQALASWLLSGKNPSSETVLYGMFYLPEKMPDGKSKKRAIGYQEFQSDFAKLWANRQTNGLCFMRGDAATGGTPDAVTSVDFFVWLKEDVPPSPGLSGKIDLILDATTGKPLREIDEHGKVYQIPNSVSGLGIFQTLAGLDLLWKLLSFAAFAIAAYITYDIINEIIIKPVGEFAKQAGKGVSNVLSSATPLLMLAALGWGAMHLLSPSRNKKGG